MRGKSILCMLGAAAFLMASLPGAQAQSVTGSLNNPNAATPTTLYFHIFDTFNAFPINTQAPDTTFFQVGGTNFPTFDDSTTGQNYDFNTIYGFATSGPVEYKFIENGQPRFHPERGIARTVQISDDPAYQPTVYIYISVRDILGNDDSHSSLGNVLADFTLNIRMKTGNVVGPDSDLDAGDLIMSGTGTWDLVDTNSDNNGMFTGTNPATQNPYATPDADGIIELKVPMTMAMKTIPKDTAYNVRIDWYQDPDGSHPDTFAEGYMRIASDSKHHSRLEMAVTNPIYIEYVHPEVAAGILLIHTAENSPWGTYDADVANMTVSIESADGSIKKVNNPLTGQSDLPVVVAQNSHVHNLHDKAAEVTYLWRFRDENAPVGDYKIHVEVGNLACASSRLNPTDEVLKSHCKTASADAGFVVQEKSAYGVSEKNEKVEAVVQESDSASSPGASFLVVAVLLVGAVLVRRRA